MMYNAFSDLKIQSACTQNTHNLSPFSLLISLDCRQTAKHFPVAVVICFLQGLSDSCSMM